MGHRVGLRERNRLAIMRDTQHVALDMFETHGFDRTTVSQMAEALAISPSTIYRHFGTKEAIVVWSEYEPALDQAVLARLSDQPALDAFRDAILDSVPESFENDFQLRRITYIYRTPALRSAMAERNDRHRDEFACVLRDALKPAEKFAAPILAGIAIATLDSAIDRWQRHDGNLSFSDMIAAAYEVAKNPAAIRLHTPIHSP